MMALFEPSLPSGWIRFTALDGRFPRGASSYGGTGGSSTHTHDMTFTTGGPSVTGGAKAIGQTTADDSHTHSCITTTDSASNVPPYMDVIFSQRNDPAVSTSVGSEVSQEESEADPVSYLYFYDGDGQMAIEATGVITTVYPSHTFGASMGGIPFTQFFNPFGNLVSEAGKGRADLALGRSRWTGTIDNQGERLYN